MNFNFMCFYQHVTMGKILYVRVKGKIIKMKADFLMGSLVKCTLHRKYRKYAKYIKKGSPVYIYRKGLDKKVDNNQGVAGETKKLGGKVRVSRGGGSWMYDDTFVWSASRGGKYPPISSVVIGFRLVLDK
jgi:hypothetical protein